MVSRVPPKPANRAAPAGRVAPAKATAAPQRGITGKPVPAKAAAAPAKATAAPTPTPTPAPAQTPVSVITLEEIVAATQGEYGFMFVPPDAPEIGQYVAQGLVEVNAEIEDDTLTKIACRATEQGIAHLTVKSTPTGWAAKTAPQVVNQTHAPSHQPHAQAETRAQVRIAKPQGGFAIASGVPMPNRSVSVREQKYPFDELQNGQSFFVPATNEAPDPAKSMAGTVSTANKRWSQVVPGQTRQGRGGKIVEVRQPQRQFVSRRVADGEPWGFPGVAGCAVYRVL